MTHKPNLLPETFCLAPFVQITTHPSGSFSPCPYLGGTSWKQSADSTLQARWNSEDLELLRQEFLNGKQPSLCQRCWNEERNGKTSLRQRITKYQVFQDQEFLEECLTSAKSGDYRQGPRVLSIKNGNLCNARCRSCHPEDSTPWIQDSQKLHQQLGFAHYKLNVEHVNWSDSQVSDLVTQAQHLRRLELFGGESLYNRQVVKLLLGIIQTGDAEHIDLYINTNGSVNILDRLPEIHKFRSIDIGVSIDSLPEHFSYVRHPLTMDTIMDNLNSWRQHFDQHGMNYMIQPIVTVSALNVYYLPEIKQYLADKFNCAPFWNLLVDPDHLAIENLPHPVKQQVIQRLCGDSDFQQFVNVMQNTGNNLAWQRFAQITSALDLVRNENFEQVMPEWANILSSHWPTNHIVIYVGDLSQSYQGQYLVHQATKHDGRAVLIQDSDHGYVVNKVDVKTLASGTYYTGVTKWRDLRKLKSLLQQAHEIHYTPPPIWSDGADQFSTVCAPRGWSAVVLEEILQECSNVHWHDPVDQ